MTIFKKEIKGLVFDMDGLLFDSERVVKRTWDLIGKELGYGECFGNHIYNTIGFNAKKRGRYFFENVSKDFPMEEFSILTREEFHKIVDREGIKIKDGAKELVMWAKENGYKVAVATSSSQKHASRLLDKGGFLEYLDGMIFGDMVTEAKPSPEIYEKACKLISLEPKECIAFEDSPAGIRSADAAGLTTVLVPDLVVPSYEINKIATYVLDSLTQVRE